MQSSSYHSRIIVCLTRGAGYSHLYQWQTTSLVRIVPLLTSRSEASATETRTISFPREDFCIVVCASVLVGASRQPQRSAWLYRSAERFLNTLAHVARLCRWIAQTYAISQVWPNGFPKPAQHGQDPGGHNRNATTRDTQGGYDGHCHVLENTHRDPAYTAPEVLMVMGDSVEQWCARQAPEVRERPAGRRRAQTADRLCKHTHKIGRLPRMVSPPRRALRDGDVTRRFLASAGLGSPPVTGVTLCM